MMGDHEDGNPSAVLYTVNENETKMIFLNHDKGVKSELTPDSDNLNISNYKKPVLENSKPSRGEGCMRPNILFNEIKQLRFKCRVRRSQSDQGIAPTEENSVEGAQNQASVNDAQFENISSNTLDKMSPSHSRSKSLSATISPNRMKCKENVCLDVAHSDFGLTTVVDPVTAIDGVVADNEASGSVRIEPGINRNEENNILCCDHHAVKFPSVTDDQVFMEIEATMIEAEVASTISDISDLSDWLSESNISVNPVYSSENFPYLGRLRTADCGICLDNKMLYMRYCCGIPYCTGCLQTYCQTRLSDGQFQFPCPNPNCEKLIYQGEVFALLEPEGTEKLYRYLINANTEPNKKTCPRCSVVYTRPTPAKKSKHKRLALKVTCSSCELLWCYDCHSPWHEHMTCKQYKKGDRLLRRWAKETHAFTKEVNARRCPRCKIYIQRSTGCDHMTCSKCGIDFCYRCGKRFYNVKFIGNHHNSLSILGCKYRLFPDKPVLRGFIRGSLFSLGLLVLPVIGAGIVVAGAAVLAGGVIASPVLVGLLIRKRQIKQQAIRDRQEMAQHQLRRREIIASRGDPYMENYLREAGVANPQNYITTSALEYLNRGRT